MRTFDICRYAFSVCVAAAMLAGCRGEGLPLSPSVTDVTAGRAHALFSYDVLYSFKGGKKDGEFPNEALINVNGTLYGTSVGGTHGAGIIFTITTSGKESVFYNFKGGSADGAGPSAPLINVNGTLYGMAINGGANGKGVIFAITTSGKETVVYSFKGAPADGEDPSGALLNMNGILYGTTLLGGSGSSCGDYGCGTVFSITTSGKEVVRYNFKGRKTDGQNPTGGLINVKGKLYGTTNGGGANCTKRGVACGTVFSVTTSGKETVLHNFKGADTDGQNPDAGLIYVKGTLYGTTEFGGLSAGGTVYSVTTSGGEKVLHNFSGSDGVQPEAGLINVKGTLYGTIFYGGASGSWGTVFEISTSGKEHVLHSFHPLGFDGYYPMASLINVNSTLYGTTRSGGSGYCGGDGYDYGCGTVFTLTP